MRPNYQSVYVILCHWSQYIWRDADLNQEAYTPCGTNLPYLINTDSLFWPHAPVQYFAAYLVGVAPPYFYPQIQKSTTTSSVPRLLIEFALLILGPGTSPDFAPPIHSTFLASIKMDDAVDLGFRLRSQILVGSWIYNCVAFKFLYRINRLSPFLHLKLKIPKPRELDTYCSTYFLAFGCTTVS